MGNHEYCEDCGESNFHLNRPCDPKKVAERKKRQQKLEEDYQKCIAYMKKKLDKAGIPYTLKSNGIRKYAEIDPISFYKFI